MKKIYLLSLSAIVLFSSAVNAQSKTMSLKPFKTDVSVGYAIPGGSGSKGGVLFAVEPKYAVMSNLSVGLRFEGAVVARFNGYNPDGTPIDASVKASGSYLATGDYYFNNNYSFHPFAGAGAGIYSLAAVQATSSGTGASAGSKFGGMIRAGVEMSHFRFGVEYNIVPKTTFSGFDSNGNPTELTSSNGYIGIKLGVCFGGGPR
jgi:outer membrane protein X